MNTQGIAETVQQCLDRTGFSQRELSLASGVPEVTLSRIRNGHSDGSGKTLKKLLPFLRDDVQSPTPSQPPEAA